MKKLILTANDMDNLSDGFTITKLSEGKTIEIRLECGHEGEHKNGVCQGERVMDIELTITTGREGVYISYAGDTFLLPRRLALKAGWMIICKTIKSFLKRRT